MPNFDVTLDNTQKVLSTFSLTKVSGEPVPITGLGVNILSGDGSFSMLDNAGNPLPLEQMYVVSGNGTGDTVYEVNVLNAVRQTIATITAHVVEGVLNVNVAFGSPEPK